MGRRLTWAERACFLPDHDGIFPLIGYRDDVHVEREF